MTPDERAQVEQELADLNCQLTATLVHPPLENEAAVAKRNEYVQRTLQEIDRLERLLGVRHVRRVA